MRGEGGASFLVGGMLTALSSCGLQPKKSGGEPYSFYVLKKCMINYMHKAKNIKMYIITNLRFPLSIIRMIIASFK